MFLSRQLIHTVYDARPTLVGTTISRTSKITHCPNTGPETSNITRTRQRSRYLENGILVEAELIPGLNHSRLEVEVVDVFLRHGDEQVSVFRRRYGWVVPFEIANCQEWCLSIGDGLTW